MPLLLQATPKLDDFPALGMALGGGTRSQQSPAGPAAPQSSSSDGDAPPAPTGVSDALKAANKASIMFRCYVMNATCLFLEHGA